MAHFAPISRAEVTGFDSGANLQTLRVQQNARVVLVEGDDLLVTIADPSVATVQDVGAGSSGGRVLRLFGVRAGKTTLEARDGSDNVQTLLNVEVAMDLTFRELLADFIVTDEDRKRLPPESVAALEKHVRELKAHEPPHVGMTSGRFDASLDMVPAGKKLPPDYHKKK